MAGKSGDGAGEAGRGGEEAADGRKGGCGGGGGGEERETEREEAGRRRSEWQKGSAAVCVFLFCATQTCATKRRLFVKKNLCMCTIFHDEFNDFN